MPTENSDIDIDQALKLAVKFTSDIMRCYVVHYKSSRYCALYSRNCEPGRIAAHKQLDVDRGEYQKKAVKGIFDFLINNEPGLAPLSLREEVMNAVIQPLRDLVNAQGKYDINDNFWETPELLIKEAQILLSQAVALHAAPSLDPVSFQPRPKQR